MKWVCWICLCGLLGNLVLIFLPDSLRPYHVHHWLDDWKIELVAQTSEYGFAPRGIQRGRFSTQYALGNRELINQIRRDWHEHVENAKIPCSSDGHLMQYNEWGPSHTVRSDGIDVVEVGLVYSVPYSFGAIVCAMPLIALGVYRANPWRTDRHLHKPAGSGIL